MLKRLAPRSLLASKRWRLLAWATFAGLVCGLIGLTRPVDDFLRTARNLIHATPASGQIVFVGIDDKSLSEVGRWPWTRSVQGQLIERATAAGADRIFLDLIYSDPSPEKAEDAAFERALASSGRVTLADRRDLGTWNEGALNEPPLERFTRHTKTASITVFYDWRNIAWRNFSTHGTGSQAIPTFSMALSGRKDVPPQTRFRIDYSIKIDSVPYLSASDVLRGKGGSLRGKTVVFGLNADQLGDQLWIPGHGEAAGALVHILGAETLKRGVPIDLEWIAPFLFALAASIIALRNRNYRNRAGLLAATVVLLLAVPVALETWLIFVNIAPALTLVSIVAGRLAWLSVRRRGMVNDWSGLPSLQALRTEQAASGQAVIVARIHNISAINAALGDAELKEANRQIVTRLATGGTTRLYQGEDGTFVWLIGSGEAFGNHLEALHSMFRSPIAVGGRHIDIALSFGVEVGSSRSVSSRVASAVLAADEAWEEGLRWKLHDPSRQEEVNWRVSLLGELDTAIDQGEVWLAYQPQLDIARNRIVGAEALARWTHPQKGPISPTEFVAAAESNGRIGKLTDFVLDRAISSAAAINRRGVEFQVAVNLSARLLNDRELEARIKTMLGAHGLAPSKLTLELTETATLHDTESGLATLDALIRLGVRVAIDDYGTGLSTLEYLRKIPADEIKIDQSFVKQMRVNHSDLIMVQSTIALAHSLGRKVVAEGVEDRQCLEELQRMGCDIAQGFAIGRPMGVRELVQRLDMRTTRRVA